MNKTLTRLLYATIILAFILSSCTGLQPAPTLPVKVDQAQVGPSIVAQQPLEGQRLDLKPEIQFVFDRDMDQAKTTQAFTLLGPDEKPVPGKAAWSDPRTFTFRPDPKLQPGSAYKATFTTSAVSLDGKSPLEDIQFKFMTTEALAVGQVFPADAAEAVEMGTNITVIFNHPVVPVTIEEEQGKLPQPLTFSPAVAGKGNWVNSSVYVFEPDQALLSGTHYSVSLEAGLSDMAGDTLDESYSWSFDTRAPAIGSFTMKKGMENPPDGLIGVLLDQAFIVNFLQPMDQQSVAENLTFTDHTTGKQFPINLTWDDASEVLTIEPEGKYQLANAYKLEIAKSAQAADGGTLKDGLTFSFNTVPFPKIISVSPAADSKAASFDPSIIIAFASPMNFDSLKSHVQITPKPKNELNWYYNDNDWKVYIYGLDPSTEYNVRLLSGMKDIYGNAIKGETAFAFTTGRMDPYANLVLPWTPLVYRAKGPQEVFFEHVNLDSATITLESIPFNTFSALVSGGKGDLTTFDSKDTTVNEWNFDAKSPQDSLQRENIQLQDSNGKPLAPGYYFVGVRGQPLKYQNKYYQSFVFIVATDNITFKATDTEGLAWVTDLESGKPQTNVPVTFYDEKYNEVGQVKTDKDGLAYLKGVKAPRFAQVTGTDHLAFASLDWGSGVSAGDFGLYESYYSTTDTPFAYLYTDRPIYRPGQDVFFKGIVRQNDDLHYSLPKNKQVYLIIDHWGEQVYTKTLPLSELGSFTDSFKLDDNAAIGDYTISIRSDPATDPFGFVSFNVAEYHKPEFQVATSPDKPAVLAGDTVNFSMDTTYYSGGNVANAQVQWFLESAPFYFNPSKDYQQFSFSDWDRDVYWSDRPSTQRGTLAEGKTTTDTNGQVEVSQSLGLSETKTSQTVAFKANVTDLSGNLVSGETSVVVHQSLVYGGIRSLSYIGTAGDVQPFEVVALDWDSEPVPGQSVSVAFVERQWFSVQEQDKQGQMRWTTSVKEIPVGTQTAVTDQDGKASVSFTPSKGGVYKATVTVTDSKGNQHQASTYVWVSSSEFIAWKQTNDRTFNLIADKDTYSPGDTAEILIAQPFETDVYALVTYERGHIYKQEVVLLKGNSTIYKIPIRGDMAPMAYVSVVVISGAEAGGKPNFKIGMTELKIDTSQQLLDVSVTADKKSAGPGEKVTYTISTKDEQGKPVSADVSLAVVDKAVLALAPANSGPLLDNFYPEQALGVRTALGIVSNADDFNANYRESITEGGGAGGGGGGELGVVTVRQDFKDTAAFEGQVTTDAAGKAEISVNLPENLTTWQADVRAVTVDSKVGQITQELISTKPLFVELQTPRFFVVGDEAQVGATLHNNTAQTLKVNVSLKAEGVAIQDKAAQSVDVPANGQAYVTWNLTVNADAKRVDLTATAASSAYTDSSKPALGTLDGQGIPVYNFTAPETVGTSGMLLKANSATEGIQLPTTLNFSDANLSVEVSPSLAASMQSGLTYLEDYPYLCMEQTVSRFLPNVISMRALKAAGLEDPKLKSELDAQVNAALQKIYAKQLYDGGWSWWDGDISDLQVSAYVVYGLIEAKDSGYPVSPSVLVNGIDYLKSNLPALGFRQDDPLAHMSGGGGGGFSDWQYNRYVFVMYVLARGGELYAGRANDVYQNREKLSLYAKSYLAQAMYLLDPKDERIASILSDLGAATVLSAAGAHWEEGGETDYWNWNTDTRTTAIVLNAFVQIDPTDPITANAVRWLMAHRNGGHWRSTQETAWTLIALTNWLTASKELEADYPFAVGLNGKSLTQGTANKDNLTDTVKLQVQLKDLLKDEVNYLVFTRGEGTGNLYYTAYLTASLPVESIQPLDQGASLSREYFALDDPKHPITEIQRGELVQVRVTIVAPSALHYLVIDDPLPAGFEAVDASLNTSTQVPTSYTRQDYDKRGWGWWFFYHKEIRDEKVVLSADYLPAGTYVYTYLARASTAGTFKVIPTTATEFYFPDVGGRGAGSVFVVKP